MLDQLTFYGPDDRSSLTSGRASFGRCLNRTLAEDDFDRQPIASSDGRWLMVADVRIDNRTELCDALGIHDAPDLSDSFILFQAWQRWREGLLNRIAGDFAFAVWDNTTSELFLARDSAGERPLHYCRAAGFVAFSSMARPLLSLPTFEARACEERMARFVADLPPSGSQSYFQGIHRVEPGCFVRISSPACGVSNSDIQQHRYWDPRGPELRLPKLQDYGDALQEQIDRAVKCRMRRKNGSLGSHLSSGFDSSAVTTSAATLVRQRSERMLAFTAAPRIGFQEQMPTGRFADESALAGETAALYDCLDHIVVRPSGLSPLSLFDADHHEAGQPVGHVCNNVWYTNILDAARRSGVKVMLTGEAGNFSLSAGTGLDELPNLLRTFRLRKWWRESRALTDGSYSWKNILHSSLGPWVPKRAYLILRGLQDEFATGAEDLTFVSPQWRSAMMEQSRRSGWHVLPPRNSKDRRWTFLQTFDPGNFRKRTLGRWGIEERDPTADRRLVEFCFSLPSQAFLHQGVRRPAMRRALESRIPTSVMEQRLRGYQMADWHEQITAQQVRDYVRHLEQGGDNGIVDLSALRKAADSWPTGNWHRRPAIYYYRSKFLRALSASHFVKSARIDAPHY